MSTEIKEHEAVTNLRKYLQIPSVHPNINYDECVKFITQQAKDMGLPVKVVTVHPGKPVVVITYVGSEPELQSILLNSHMDVVPVEKKFWSRDPFAAEKDKNGNIYARGAQDMKSIGILYLETIRRYLKEGLKLKRTIHISFVPDEEIGSDLGMKLFVETDDFKKLNIGFALDEAGVSPTDEYHLLYAERLNWKIDIICRGTSGHGSVLHENTAAEKLNYMFNKFMDLREKEKEKLKRNSNKLHESDVTSINLTMLKGGTQNNVIPAEFAATFDVRVTVDADVNELESKILKWCKEAGEGVRCEFTNKDPKVVPTRLDDSNPWWIAMKNECDKMNMKLKTLVCPAGTDNRFIRNLGIPALGFSPFIHTPFLLHNHDEFLNEDIFLRGLEIYYKIIKGLASI